MKTIFLLLILLSNYSFCKNENTHPFFINNSNEMWTEISDETIDFLVNHLKYTKLEPGYSHYEYLYQLSPIDTLFNAPYIVVQVNNSGRLTWKEIQSFRSASYKYDSQKKYLFKYADAKLYAIIPTNRGTINIYCYAKNIISNRKDNQFISFVNSIELLPSQKYNKNFVRDIPILGDLLWNTELIKILLIIIAILLLLRFTGRKKQVTRTAVKY